MFQFIKSNKNRCIFICDYILTIFMVSDGFFWSVISLKNQSIEIFF